LITEVEIGYFQPHIRILLNFTEGLNVIKGHSDVGKSSIVRAIAWVIENRPLGFGFRFDPKISGKKTKFSDDDLTFCRVKFSDGTEVIRERNNKGVNQYRVSGIKDPLEALRGDVPEEVQKALNLAYYNLHKQQDIFFLLQDTPGEVARKINDIVGLNIIDTTLKRINSIISEAKSETKRSEKKLESLSQQIEELAFIDKVEPLLVKAEEYENDTISLTAMEEDLRSVISSIKELKDQEKDVASWLSVEKHYKKIMKIQEEIYELDDTENEIATLLDDIVIKLEAIDDAEDFLSIEDSYNVIMSLHNRANLVIEEEKALFDMISSIKLKESKIEQIESTKVQAEKEYQDFVDNLPESCPLCKQPINKELLLL